MPEMIKLTSAIDGFAFGALHAAPEGRRRGGVIVVQEIFGIDDYIQADVARWAARGFEVLAPSMFDRQNPGFVAAHGPEGMKAGLGYVMANGVDNALADIEACMTRLASEGPVFLVGYCYGGLMTWLAAGKLDGLAGASSYYGRLAEQASVTPKCPIICHFGANDGHIPAEPTKAALNAAQPQVDVYIYENSGHGFNNEAGPDADPGDAALARDRTVALFAAHGAE